ncbi:hypothetical protein ABPG77_003119 [Micractinium sp. CCAP 211/92]
MDAPLIEPSDFDLVVIGTGLTESIVAAAAAKAGHSVLQLDPSDHYGGAWASLPLDELSGVLRDAGADVGALSGAASQPGQQPGLQLRSEPAAANDGEQEDSGLVPAAPGAAAAAGIRNAQVWRRTGADLGPVRQYCLDLAPKVAYGWGPAIQLLLGSGAHNYLEFKLVQGSYLLDAPGTGGAASPAAPVLRSVPSSRSEVFKDRHLSPVQKRCLMRFLKAAAEALEGEGPLKDAFGAQPIRELLAGQGLDVQLQQALLHGVLLLDSCPPCGGSAGGGGSGAHNDAGAMAASDALERLRMFVQSAGRYGSGTGPFLTPLYGCGELPQAFSRTAAVAGAVQVLRCGLAGLSFDEHTFSCDGVELASGQTIRCRQLAADASALADWLETFRPAMASRSTHRCCAVLDGPLVPGEQHSMIAVLPAAVAQAAGAGASSASTGTQVVRALALCSSTAVCPPGRHVLYLWADAGDAINSSSSSSAGQRASAADALLHALAVLADTTSLQADSSAPGSQGDAAAAAAELASSAEPSSSSGSGNGKPAVLWAAFYTQDSPQLVPAEQLAGPSSGRWPSNVALCPGPDSTVTMASAVEAAKDCYWQLFPPGDRGAGTAGAAAFPLDPRQPRDEAGAEDKGAEDGMAGAAAAAEDDAGSDDEALAALQAALQAARLGPGTAEGEKQQ